MKNLALIVTVFFLTSCDLISQRNIYEGIRSQQKIKDVNSNQKSQTLPPYEQYEKERENQLRNNAKN